MTEKFTLELTIEELKLLDKYEWQPFQHPFDVIYVMEMEMEE